MTNSLSPNKNLSHVSIASDGRKVVHVGTLLGDDDSSVSDGRKVFHVVTLLEDRDDDSSASDGRKVFHVSTLFGDDDSSSASIGFRTAGDTSATAGLLMAASYLTQSPILRTSADAFRTLHRTPSNKPTNVVRRLLPRREVLVLGAGAFFWAQSANMSLTSRGNSFLASARPSSPIERVLKDVEWPEQFPFKEEDFQRFDESPDSLFYEAPRFVTHIDDPAIAALTKYYSRVLPPSNTPGVCILDMCSSWVSHYPKGYKQERIVGMGMNEDELKRNPLLTEYILQDLNVNPKLPFEDNSFDAITNVVSVDYLTKPLDIFKEMSRILKPGGQAIMSFSNRCFWSKAISIWTSTGDTDHVMIVGAYFHYAGGFEPPQAVDISPNPGRSDPMYVVYSRKVSSA